MNKLKHLIQQLNEEDLTNLKRDLDSGNLQKLISKRLDELRLKDKNCPVCGEKIDNESFVLEFGKGYLRRKAYFDGSDCLEYFLNKKIKKIKT